METTYRTRHWTLQLQGAMQLQALSRIWCAVCDRPGERGTVYQNVNVAESSTAHVSVCLPCWATITAPTPAPGATTEAPTVTVIPGPGGTFHWTPDTEVIQFTATTMTAPPATHTHPCPTCHHTRPCTGTGCADGPRECTTCSQCRGW